MPGRMEAHTHAVVFQRIAIPNHLCAPRKRIAIAQTHNIERFLSGQNRTMTGARVIGMPMRDQGLCDRLGGINVKTAGSAAYA
jgi:hypothetical protein